jgi:O-antigen ligase
LLYGLYAVCGLAAGFILAGMPLALGFMSMGALVAVLLPFFSPVWTLGLFVTLLIIMTDAVHTASGSFFAIPDADLVEGLPSALVTYFLFMCAVLILKYGIIGRRRPMYSLRPLVIYAVILALALLTGLRHDWDAAIIRVDFLTLLLPVVFFYLCMEVLQNRRTIIRLLWLIMVVTCLKSVILALFYVMGRGWPYYVTSEISYRIASFDSADLIAGVATLLMAFSLFTFPRTTNAQRMLLVMIAAPVLFVLVFSYRRAQWIGFALSVMFMIPLAHSVQRRRILTVLVLVLLMGTLALMTSEFGAARIERIMRRITSVFDARQDSNRYHLVEAQQTWHDIMQSPVLGLGLGGCHQPLGLYEEEPVPTNVVHNAWLYFWMKLGLPGLLFLVWAFGAFILKGLRARNRPDGQAAWPWAMPLVAGAGLWLAMSLTGPIPWYYHQTFLFAFFAAAAMKLTLPHERNEERST